MKYLYALMGAPGVGKSTWLEETSKNLYNSNRLLHYVVSPDEIRKIVQSPELKPDGKLRISPQNESFVWNFIWEIVDRKVERGELIIVDATHSRERAINAYKKYSDKGYRIIIVDFRDYADLEEILQRNQNREPLKFVPPDRIRTIQERLKTINIPSWVEVIKPDEFINHFINNKFDYTQFETVTFIGDVHSCVTEFYDLLESLEINPDEKDVDNALVFVGDYFDRGPQAVETFKLLRKLKQNKHSLFLMGNHEEPLRFYKEFIQEMNDATQKWIKEYLLPSLDDSKLVEIKLEPEVKKIALKYLGSSYKKLDSFVEELKKYPETFKAFSAFVYSWGLPQHLRKDTNTGIQKIRGTSIKTIKEFFLSDIKYTEIMDFVKRCAQMGYFTFAEKDFVVTHGGITTTPDKTIPTAYMIRGVGDYQEALLCDQTFHKKHPNVIGIHGHRNMTQIPIQSTPGTFNINGDVDQGLRAVKFFKDGSFQTVQISPNEETLKFYREQQLKHAKTLRTKKLSVEDESKGIMQLFQDHKHIDVKKLPDNIAAINFTRKAFENGVWDNLTIKARGLFMAIDPKEELPLNYIIARGYEKFFNLGERFGFTNRDVNQMAFPIKAYEKANGYLGILSVDSRDPDKLKWFIASKTTTQGEYAENFKRMITPFLNNKLKEIIAADRVTLLFEVIEPNFDPHIQEYSIPSLILLDAVENQLEFKKKDIKYLMELMDHFGSPKNDTLLRVKHTAKVCETFSDFFMFVEEANKIHPFDPNGVEGYVFEDAVEGSPNMFKIKTRWYNFWKFMRSMKDRIASRLKKDFTRTGVLEIEKSNLIKLKSSLHTEEDIKVFNFMYEYATESEENFNRFQEMDIIQVRKEFLKTL